MKLKLRKLNLKNITLPNPVPKHQKKALDITTCHYLTQIINFLYLSDFKTVEDEEFLTKNKIEIIINLTSEKCPNSLSKKFKIIEFNIKDNPDVHIFETIKKVTEKIDQFIKLKKNIVVHCYKGISRAPTMIMAYLMLFRKFNFEKAFEFVREKSPIVDPNAGFLIQLSNLLVK